MFIRKILFHSNNWKKGSKTLVSNGKQFHIWIQFQPNRIFSQGGFIFFQFLLHFEQYDVKLDSIEFRSLFSLSHGIMN